MTFYKKTTTKPRMYIGGWKLDKTQNPESI
jgi:hypothetical protein